MYCIYNNENGSAPLFKTMNLHCNQCALVTSSSHILGSNMGAKIDQSECVIRMNDAPTAGYEKDAGNRTTVRVVAHSSVYRVVRRPQEFLNKTPDPVIIFWGPPTKISKDSKSTLFRLIQRVSINLSMFTIAPKWMRQFDDLFHKETGRDSTRSQPRKMPYHYYEPKGPDECATFIQNERGRKGNHHRFITEKQVFARWAKLYNITFSNPQW
ncbi:UNVERIFIED_CONTAM: hypothetical protein FKN15_029809 [Acipenser sinensis]